MRHAAIPLILALSALPALAQETESSAENGPDGARVTAPTLEAVDPGRFATRPSDIAYGAFQRGYYITALNLASPLALQGDPAAQTLVAEIYSRGLGVQRDPIRAAEFYEKAAEQNVPEALFQFAMMLLEDSPEFNDAERGYDLMKRAAEAGHRLAQFNLAQMIVARSTTESGLAQAAVYYEKAAEAGLPDAQYAMAQLYRTGRGGKAVDPEKARLWLEKAAAQNFDTAQIEFGTELVESNGGPDVDEAGFGWLMRAAQAGNPAAQNRVAKLYRSGVGVEADRVTAVAWYLRARRAGLIDPLMEDQIDGLTEDELKLANSRAAVL